MARAVTASTPPAARRTAGRWARITCQPLAARWPSTANTQERHGRTGRVEESHEQRRGPHPVVGGGHGDGGQDRAGAGNEDQAQAQPENQPAAPAGVAGRPQPAEGTLDPLAHRPGRATRPPERTGTRLPARTADPAAGPGRSTPCCPTSTVKLKLRTSPAMISSGRRRSVAVVPPASTTGRTGTMQGDSPVISPPRKATARSSATPADRTHPLDAAAWALLAQTLPGVRSRGTVRSQTRLPGRRFAGRR